MPDGSSPLPTIGRAAAFFKDLTTAASSACHQVCPSIDKIELQDSWYSFASEEDLSEYRNQQPIRKDMWTLHRQG